VLVAAGCCSSSGLEQQRWLRASSGTGVRFVYMVRVETVQLVVVVGGTRRRVRFVNHRRCQALVMICERSKRAALNWNERTKFLLDHLFGALNPARILGLGSATGRDLISITIGSSRLLISRLSWPGSSRSVLYVFKLVWQRARHPRQSAPSSSTPALHRRPVLRRSERKDLSTCMIYMLYARTTFYSASSHVTAACSRAAPPGPDTLHGWPGHEGDAI
jgi:hypothetical protein